MKNKLQILYEKRDALNRQRHQLLDEIKELEFLLAVKEMNEILSDNYTGRELQYKRYWFVRKYRNKYPDLVAKIRLNSN